MCKTFAAIDYCRIVTGLGLFVLVGGSAVPAGFAQAAPAAVGPTSQAARPAPTTGTAPRPTEAGVNVSPEFLIGPDDVLGISFWKEPDMTGDVTVRPDGRITLPLIGEMQAAGLTPDALKEQIQKVATKLFEDPTISVIVRTINSRKVFITGSVTRPGSHPLTRELTAMQLIAMAGGLTEFADKKNIRIVRTEGGKQKTFKLNYNDVAQGKNLEQNIVLMPGDTVIVQ
jgi:polysaccharide biosynthesis/export protein